MMTCSTISSIRGKPACWLFGKRRKVLELRQDICRKCDDAGTHEKRGGGPQKARRGPSLHDNPVMRQFFPSRLVPPLTTTALWALAFGSCVFWGLRLSAPAAGSPYPPAARSSAAAPDTNALARALG